MPDRLSDSNPTQAGAVEKDQVDLIECFGTVSAIEEMFKIKRTEAGDYICVDCGKPVQNLPVILSEHASEFGKDHAGSGGIKRFLIPYCGEDLAQPPIEGCVHVPMFSGEGERAIYLDLA